MNVGAIDEVRDTLVALTRTAMEMHAELGMGPGRTIGDWTAYADDDDRMYYRNEASGETTWDAPPGFAGGEAYVARLNEMGSQLTTLALGLGFVENARGPPEEAGEEGEVGLDDLDQSRSISDLDAVTAFMANCCAHDFERQHGRGIGMSDRSLRRLYTACERARETLLSSTQARIEIDHLDGIDFESTITRAGLVEAFADSIENGDVAYVPARPGPALEPEQQPPGDAVVAEPAARMDAVRSAIAALEESNRAMRQDNLQFQQEMRAQRQEQEQRRLRLQQMQLEQQQMHQVQLGIQEQLQQDLDAQRGQGGAAVIPNERSP